MASNSDICRMTAAQLAILVRNRKLSPVEIVDAVLERMARLEPAVHAFCTPAPEVAKAEARRLEQEITAGQSPGPLAGVPVSIKDLIFTKGIRTTFGSVVFRDFTPEEDDVAVERLKAAGAIVIGKTNTTEFGYAAVGHNPLFDTTRNPWNLAMTPGGSSAGAAAAVAAAMGPLALGSDGGGSVRIPAAFCGLVGFKPTMGRIPLYPGSRDERYPGASGWESLECYGPIARSVADAALMMSAMAGPDPRDRLSLPDEGIDWTAAPSGSITGLRIAYSRDWGYAPVDPEVARIVADAVRVFERDLGCVVEEANPGWDDPANAFSALIVADTDLRGMRRMIETNRDRMSSHLVDLMLADWSAEDLTSANIVRKSIVNRMWRFMMRYDLILTPATCVAPFPIHMQGPEKIADRYVRPAAWLAFTYPANLTGQPACSVPAGWTRDGLPVGLQIIGRRLEDTMVLRAAAAFEAARPWADRWPPLASE